MDRIRLAEMIELVCDELLYAESLREKRGHIMRFDECELEMAVETETAEGGKVKIWVVELGGDKKKTNSNTIKVRFKNLEGEPMVFSVEDHEASGPPLGYDSEQS